MDHVNTGAPETNRPTYTDDVRDRERGERFYELINEVALPFAHGAVPTMPVVGAQYAQLISGVRSIYRELEPAWNHLKAGSTNYVTSAAILSHPTFAPTRTAIGLLSSRVGDAAPRQEWIFASTGPADPIVYATLRGAAETPTLKHVNSLAALVLELGSTDFGPYRTPSGAPRVDDHWPEWTGLSEEDLRRYMKEQDDLARKLGLPGQP